MRVAFAPTLAFGFSVAAFWAGLVMVGLSSPLALIISLAAGAFWAHALDWRNLRTALSVSAGLLAIVWAVLFIFVPTAAMAQSSSSAVAVVSGTDVSVQAAGVLNPILEFVGGLLTLAVAGLVAMAVRFLPAFIQPLITSSVQAAIEKFIEQGIGFAIQEVEGFDKDKTVNFNVGSAGVASALAYVLNQAPAFLIKLAGGKDAITSLIVSFLGKFGIVLDTGVSAQQVVSTAAKSTS